MDRIKNFIKNAGIYLIGSVFSKLIAFILLPLYTNCLMPDVMGEYDYAVTLMSFAAPVCFFQIWDAMFRFSFDYADENLKRKVVNNAFFVSFLGIFLYIAVFWGIHCFVEFEYTGFVFVYGISAAVNYLYIYLARVYRRNVLFAVSGFINSLAAAVSNIVMILYLDMGLDSLYLAAIAGAFLQCIIIEIRIRPFRYMDLKDFDSALSKRMMKFSIPLCVATVSYWLLSGLTKIIIVNQLGTYENGLYAVTNKFAMLLNTVVSIFQFAWNETAYLANKDEDRQKLYLLAVKYVFHFVITASCMLLLISKIVFPYVIGDSYQASMQYLPASILAVAFNAAAGFIGTIFSAEKQTKYIFGTTITAAVLNCVFGPVLTGFLGLHGAILALAISFGTLLGGRIFWLRRKLEIPVSSENFLVCFLFILTSAVFYLFHETIITLLLLLLLIIFELNYHKENIYKAIGFIKGGRGERK